MKTAWTQERLERAFQHYNEKFWGGRIRGYALSMDVSGYPDRKWMGRMESNRILIDIEAHRSDRQARSTLLHEMAHAAVSIKFGKRRILHHGYEFWAEIEQLLRTGAPVEVGDPEADIHILGAEAVPKKFKLSRLALERAERKRPGGERMLSQLRTSGKSPTIHAISDDEIVREFEDAALELTWKEALVVVGEENGLLDVGNQPKNRWAANIIERGRRVHARTRKLMLEEKRVMERFQRGAGQMAQNGTRVSGENESN